MASLLSYALTNVADVKESLGIASSDTSWDNLITRKINQVTQAVMSYCQRNFVLQQYVEVYRASHIDEMVLNQRPIVVDANHPFTAEWRTTAFNDDVWETIDSQLYFLNTDSGILELMYNSQGYWQRYRYTYWAGYAVLQADLNAGIAGLPIDLQEAVNTITCWYVNNPAGLGVYLAGRTEGQRQVRYVLHANKSFALLMAELGVDDIINNYADVSVLTDR